MEPGPTTMTRLRREPAFGGPDWDYFLVRLHVVLELLGLNPGPTKSTYPT